MPAAQVSDQAKRELTFEKKHLVACALLVEEREPRAAAECELARKTALQPQRDRRYAEARAGGAPRGRESMMDLCFLKEAAPNELRPITLSHLTPATIASQRAPH